MKVTPVNCVVVVVDELALATQSKPVGVMAEQPVPERVRPVIFSFEGGGPEPVPGFVFRVYALAQVTLGPEGGTKNSEPVPVKFVLGG